jgi:hypothetical protein
LVHGRLLQIILNEKAKGKNSFTFIILTNTTKLDVQIKETFLNPALNGRSWNVDLVAILDLSFQGLSIGQSIKNFIEEKMEW